MDAMVVSESNNFMPVMAIQQAQARRDALVQFVKGMMVDGQDFGKVPGTDKATLLKPGAEKLSTFFGMSPVFVSERVTENFGDDGSEPLFFYRYRCELYRNGVLMGQGLGSANSRESKYRYRKSERVCPQCGKSAIIKGKADFGGGYICWTKNGGCGAKFTDSDERITGQVVGKVLNPDIADVVNTLDKMAQKRALIAAVLIAVNASEFFTQDVEDMDTGYVDFVSRDIPFGDDPEQRQPQRKQAQQSTTTGQAQRPPAKQKVDEGKPHGQDPAMYKRYNDTKEAARKSGKFGGDKHLDNAWTKMFQEYNASDTNNGEKFLAAWAEYVEKHEAAKQKATAVVDSIDMETLPEIPA